MSASETIEMATLGRPFQLGTLYDCRRDALIPGITLWDAKMLQNHIDVCPQPNTDFQILTSESTEVKASALDVSASLASFLCGLVSVKGSAGYLKDKKTSKNQSRVTLHYRTTTRFEQLNVDFLGAGNVQYCNVFQEGSATHVVTAVLYGAQAFFIFDREISAEGKQQEVQGSLHEAIKKIPSISIEGEASLRMTDEEREQLSCKFYGDFALENNPVTFQDAIKVYSTLSHLLGNDGEHAVPMKVWLYPLVKLNSQAAQLVRQISTGLVHNLQCILEEFDDYNIKCQDLIKEATAIQFEVIKHKLLKFKDLCLEYKHVFQKSLAKLLPSIRGGDEEECRLIDLLKSRERSPFRNALLEEFLEDKECELNVLKSNLQIMSNIAVVSSSDLDQVLLDSANEYVVCFAFTSLKQREKYLTFLEKYLISSKQEKNTECSTEVALQHDSEGAPEKWFRSDKVTALSTVFSDFEKINKSRPNVQFFVASVSDEINTGSSVYLYERGDLASKHFELPSQPGEPTVLNTEHHSVQLQFHPPKHGIREIVRYRVLYQKMGNSDWVEVDTDGSMTEFTVLGLDLNTLYRFCCQAVCKPGVSSTSNATDYCKTLPSGPPGAPQERSSRPNSITVTWEAPSSVGQGVSVSSYEVEYREVQIGAEDRHERETWTKLKVRGRVCTLGNLKAGTSCIIRVSSDCGKEGKSSPSPETEITVPKKSEVIIKSSHVNVQSDNFLNYSDLLEEGQPSLYRLSLEKIEKHNSNFQQFTFGDKAEKEDHKVIMFLGATGAGKSTIINTMINYILGVQWEDWFRFKLIHEETNRSQAESQTSIVTSYELHHQKEFPVPYSLTVIDTPGFGDTRGLSRDKQMMQQVKHFFSDPTGVDHIDAVCFVVQASLARLTPSQQYVFDSILAIFGKDIAENILILVTFADGTDIPVLGAIKAAGLCWQKKQDHEVTYFKFNNSVLYAQNKRLKTESDDLCVQNYFNKEDSESDEDDEEEEDIKLKKIIWTKNVKQMKRFFQTLEKIQKKDLTLTRKVLEERERLETVMVRLLPQIKAGLAKLSEISKIKQCLENEKSNIEQNKNFEIEIDEVNPKRLKTNHFSTNCVKCLISCHAGCFLSTCDDTKDCAVIDDSGHCVICPGHCHYTDHVSEMTTWEYETKKVKKTVEQLKNNYLMASNKYISTNEILKKMEIQFQMIKDTIFELIQQSCRCLARLEETALKPKTLSTAAYIDLLIRQEKEESKSGFEDRIAELEKMKKHSEIINKISRNETVLLPDNERKSDTDREKNQ